MDALPEYLKDTAYAQLHRSIVPSVEFDEKEILSAPNLQQPFASIDHKLPRSTTTGLKIGDNISDSDPADCDEDEDADIDIVVGGYLSDFGSDDDALPEERQIDGHSDDTAITPELLGVLEDADTFARTRASVLDGTPVSSTRTAQRTTAKQPTQRKQVPALPQNLGMESLLQKSHPGWFGQHNHDRVTLALSDVPIPPETGVYFYEIELAAQTNPMLVALGISIRPSSGDIPGNGGFSNAAPQRSGFREDLVAGPVRQMSSTTGLSAWLFQPGSGRIVGPHGSRRRFGSDSSESNVVGCGVNFARGTIFFTRGADFIGEAFTDIYQEMRSGVIRDVGSTSVNCDSRSLGVAVSLAGSAQVRVNWGQKQFEFNIGEYVDTERAKVLSKVEVAAFKPTSESILGTISRALVAGGYADTLAAFNQNYLQSSELSKIPSHELAKGAATIGPRREFRRLLMQGDIDAATALLHSEWPGLCDHDSNLQFWIRAQQAIQVIREAATDITRLDDGVARAKDLWASFGGTIDPEQQQHLRKINALLGVTDPDSRPELRSLYSEKAVDLLSSRVSAAILANVGFGTYAEGSLSSLLKDGADKLTTLSKTDGAAALVTLGNLVS